VVRSDDARDAGGNRHCQCACYSRLILGSGRRWGTLRDSENLRCQSKLDLHIGSLLCSPPASPGHLPCCCFVHLMHCFDFSLSFSYWLFVCALRLELDLLECSEYSSCRILSLAVIHDPCQFCEVVELEKN